MSIVNYDLENLEQCICGGCPVQENSACIIEKKPKYHKLVHQAREGNTLPPVDTVIGLYCSTEVGKSTCKDLNCDALCSCPECPVFINNSLDHLQYCI